MQPTRSATFRPDCVPLPSLRPGSVGEHCPAATSVALVVWRLLKLRANLVSNRTASDGVATPPPSGEAPESPRTNLKVSGGFRRVQEGSGGFKRV